MGAPFPLPVGELAYEGMELVHAAFAGGLQPDPDITVTEWSDEHRYLSAVASAAPDKYRSSRTPYLIEPMDNLSPSSLVVQTTELKGAQIGASESALNAVGFHMDASPCSILYVLPDKNTAEQFSKQRIDPMIKA
jgi:phage terminase large subunit GpA-like protein